MLKKGFSLVEVLMGMGLITLLLTIGPLILASTFNSSKKATETGKIKEIGASALNVMVQKIKYAKEVKCLTSNTLEIKMLDNSTLSYSASNNLTESDGASINTLVQDGLQSCGGNFFTCGQVVSICFVISNTLTGPNESATTKFQTQVKLRNENL